MTSKAAMARLTACLVVVALSAWLLPGAASAEEPPEEAHPIPEGGSDGDGEGITSPEIPGQLSDNTRCEQAKIRSQKHQHGLPLQRGDFMPMYSSVRLDERAVELRRAVIYAHGLSAMANVYFCQGVDIASKVHKEDSTLTLAPWFGEHETMDHSDMLQKDTTLTLVPWFGNDSVTAENWDSTLPPGSTSISWSGDGWMEGDDSIPGTSGSAYTSFEILDTIVALLKARRREGMFPALEQITIAGFSAGCQLTSRWALFSPMSGTDGVQIVLASCGSWLYLDQHRPGPSCVKSLDTGVSHNCSDFGVPAGPVNAYDEYKYGLTFTNHSLNLNSYLGKFVDVPPPPEVGSGVVPDVSQLLSGNHHLEEALVRLPSKNVRFMHGIYDVCHCNIVDYANPDFCFHDQAKCSPNYFQFNVDGNYCCDTFPDAPWDNALDSSLAANMQGTNRLQRSLNYMSYLKMFYKMRNVEYEPIMAFFEGKHDSGACFSSTAFASWVFGVTKSFPGPSPAFLTEALSVDLLASEAQPVDLSAFSLEPIIFYHGPQTLVGYIFMFCITIFTYAMCVKNVVMSFKTKGNIGIMESDGSWLRVDGDVPIMLQTLAQMRAEERLDGAVVKKALVFTSLLDLMVETQGMAIEDTTTRTPLRHTDLAAFVQDLNLAELGLGPGDRMACMVPNGPEAAVLILASFAKCAVVPISPTATQHEMVADAGRVRAQVMIVHKDYLENSKQCAEVTAAAAELGIALVQLTPDAKVCGRFSLRHVASSRPLVPVENRRSLSCGEDTSLLLFTSGTSGSKKCVPYTLSTLLVGSANIIASWELQPCDRVCNMMPLFHVGGITRNLLSPMLSGGSACLCGSFDPILFWDIVQQRQKAITWYYAGPVMHQLILKEFKSRGLSPYKFRFIANAAGGLLPSMAREMQSSYSCPILPGYGMTECMPISAPPLSYRLGKEGTSGRRVGPKLKIFSDDGAEAPAGTVGNIVVKGPPAFTGYEGDPEATSEAFFEGGWFNTGDLGYLDQDGYLYITGRSKEVINRGGEIVSPFEIEDALQLHPRIKAVIAFSVPHDVLEEGIGVAVVPADGEARVSLRTVQQWCKKSLTFAKWPQVLVIMPDLPKNRANKVLRVKMAERLQLKEHWGGSMTDDMPEVARTFFADCPDRDASLKVLLPNVRQLRFCLVSLSRRLLEAGAAVGVLDAAFGQVGTSRRLCACVVPDTVDTKALLQRIKGVWDDWEVPAVIVAVPELPRAVPHGPVDAEQLVQLLKAEDPDYVGPKNDTEEALQKIWAKALGQPRLSVDADFFDSGGTSLLAGPLALAIQEELKVPFTAVDVFSATTIQDIAELLEARRKSEREAANKTVDGGDTKPTHAYFMKGMAVTYERSYGNTHPFVLFIQALPFFLLQPLVRAMNWVVFVICFVHAQTFIEERCLTSLLLAFVIALAIMSVLNPLVFIAAKWCIIGKYKEGEFPLFGNSYLKWWMVNQLQWFVSRGVLQLNLPLYYRLLGAKIGAGVKITQDCNLSEFDLLNIESNVALDCCFVRPFAMKTNNSFTMRHITIGEKSTVCAKSVVAGGAVVPPGTDIGPLSSSYEMQDARPENRRACRVLRQQPPMWLCIVCGYPILFMQKFFALLPQLLLLQNMMAESWHKISNAKLDALPDGLEYFAMPERIFYYIGLAVLRKIVTPFLLLLFAIAIKRGIIGKFTETPDGQEPDLHAWELFRPWLLERLIPDAHLCGVTQLVGRHYELISMLYRLLGVKVGRRVYWPGSGFRFAEPDLVEIGDFVVFGSRSFILTSDSEHRRQAVRIEPGGNVSDRCVILPGTTVKCGAVLGSGALSKQGKTYAAGTYVGNRGNECVLLKKGLGDTKLQESSYSRAFENRSKMPYFVLPELAHIMWCTSCITLTVLASRLPLVLSLWFAHRRFELRWFDTPTTIEVGFILCCYVALYPVMLVVVLAIDISSKWLFMGRRQPGSYAWDVNSYNQRWQLYLSLAPLRSFAGGHKDFLDFFRGSQFLVWYYRALGARIGKGVCLYPNGADPMMTEPEMVTIQDGACIDDASLIAHLNTQGNFTLNTLEVGHRCVMRTFSRLQQSAVMEPRSVLLEHTLVLPGDTVKAGERRQGWPSGLGRRSTSFDDEHVHDVEEGDWMLSNTVATAVPLLRPRW